MMKWVDEVKATAKPITEEKFNELLEPGHVGQSTLHWNSFRIFSSS